MLKIYINPIFPEDFSDMSQSSASSFDYSVMDGTIVKEKKQKKFLICYASTNCPHCLNAIQKISVTQKNKEDFIDVFICFLGDEEGVNYFFDIAGVKQHYNILPQDKFIEIAGASFPSFVLLQDGVVTKKWSARTFNYYAIQNLEK